MIRKVFLILILAAAPVTFGCSEDSQAPVDSKKLEQEAKKGAEMSQKEFENK